MRRTAGSLALFAAFCIALWLPGERSGFGQAVEGRLLDLRFLLRGPLPSPDTVAVVAFDDAAMAQNFDFPLSREDLAAVVASVADAGARVVVLDLLLTNPRDGDNALVDALSATRAVLAVAEAPPETDAPDLPAADFALLTTPPPATVLPALGPTAALAASAALGHAVVTHASDGSLRRMHPARALAVAGGIGWYPGLAVAAVAAGGAGPALVLPATGIGGQLDLGGRTVLLDLQGTIPLDFYGPSGTIPTISAGALDRGDLAGRVVFIGATAAGFGDRHATAFDATFPGVELHATLAANLLEGRVLRRDAAAWGLTTLLAMTAAGTGFLACGISRPGLLAAVSASIVAATLGMLQAAFLSGWWLDATTVLMALTISMGTGVWLLWSEQKRRATNLGRYQSPELVDLLADDASPDFSGPTGSAVVLFVDVAGFTSHAETLDPLDAEGFLRLFHGILEQAAEPLGGTIAHFAGDGAMIVFGLLKAGPDDAVGALHFVERLFAAVRECRDWPGLGVRVGAHRGPVRTGLMGGRIHRHVSVSGDVVNIASRLQELARQQAATVALSDALVQTDARTRHWVGRNGFRQLDPQTLRGRSAPVDVWVGNPFAG
jgi:adenylate cyclase